MKNIIGLFVILYLAGGASSQEANEKAQASANACTAAILIDGKLKGAGVLIQADNQTGWILTSSNVVSAQDGAAGKLAVTFPGSSKSDPIPATWVATLGEMCLAALKIEAPDLPAPPAYCPTWTSWDSQFSQMLISDITETPGKHSVVLRPGKISMGSQIGDSEMSSISSCAVDVSKSTWAMGGPAFAADGSFALLVVKESHTKQPEGIPAYQLRNLLRGRIIKSTIKGVESQPGIVKVGIRGTIVNFFGTVKRAWIYHRPEDTWCNAGGGGIGAYGYDKLYPVMESAPLVIDGCTISGQLTLTSSQPKDLPYALQLKCLDHNGTPIYSRGIPFNAPFSKTIKLDKDDWMEADKKKLPETPAGQVPGERSALGDATVTRLAIPATDVLDSMIWTRNGNGVLLLTKGGLLRRFAFPTLKEEAKVDLKVECIGMSRSKPGLVILLKSGELYLVDEITFDVKKKMPGEPASQVLASPATDIAFVCQDSLLHTYDLSAGRSVAQVRAGKSFEDKKPKSPGTNPPHSWNGSCLTPDGKFLVVVGPQCVYRFRVSGTRVVYEDASPNTTSIREIQLSPDGLYVGFFQERSGGGKGPDEKGVHILDIMDLEKPVLFCKARSGYVEFDPAAGKIYMSPDSQDFLGVYTAKGELRKTYAVSGRDRFTSYGLLVHPGGDKILIHGSGVLYWLELPR